MSYAKWGTGTLALSLLVGLVGCSQKMTKEEMKAMMPERPAELNHLDMFVGDWNAEFTMEMAGMEEACTHRCNMSYSWDCDNWVLVEKAQCEGDDMDPMKSLGCWSYDVKAGKFRNFWMGTSGMMSQGAATYNPGTRTWKVKAVSHTPWGKSTGYGTMTVISDDTVNWDWKETVFFGLIKVMEGHGTMHRQ